MIERWEENPYWQYFCGETTFTHKPPINPSLMKKWRDRVKSYGVEKLLEETIHAGLKLNVIQKSSFTHLNNGAEGRNRTADTGIFSPLLYRLSYLGTHI